MMPHGANALGQLVQGVNWANSIFGVTFVTLVSFFRVGTRL